MDKDFLDVVLDEDVSHIFFFNANDVEVVFKDGTKGRLYRKDYRWRFTTGGNGRCLVE